MALRVAHASEFYLRAMKLDSSSTLAKILLQPFNHFPDFITPLQSLLILSHPVNSLIDEDHIS